MPIENITAYRVFVASPGGLEKERKAFRQALLLYNETDAIHEGVLFIPVGWEDTLGGVGRPQSIINEDLRKCDFTVMLFWKRWGSATDQGDSRFSSGTEEEFHIAMESYRDPAHPMRQVVTFFKAVRPELLADPGEQLTKVLEFRKRLEREKEHLFHVFDTTRSFEDLLRRHFSAWLRSIRQGGDPAPVPTATLAAVEREEAWRESVSAPSPERAAIEEAWRLADEGRRTEAEALLAGAAVGGRDPEALIAYGQFLFRDGRLEQAKSLLEHAVAVAEAQGSLVAAANARRWIGIVLYTRGELDDAEQMCREALEMNQRAGNEKGAAVSFGSLGLVFHARGDLEGAEQMHQKALKTFERLGNQEGIAAAYGSLGLISRARGDFEGAEQMHRKALEINEQLDRQEGIAANLTNLGNLFLARLDLDRAEQMFRKSLEINERLGYRERIAITYSSLGGVFYARGDLEGAERLYRKSLEIAEQVGALDVLANNRRNLGLIFEEHGNKTVAQEEFTRALDLYRRLGNPAEIKRVEENLKYVAEP